MPLTAFENLPTLKASWLTIGIFDGVHRGHQHIMATLTQGAHASGVPAVAITFDPHPATILAGVPMPRLTTPEEKHQLLTNLGVDHVIVLPFNQHIANMGALEFITATHQRLHFSQLITGHDFALGRGREGNHTLISTIGQTLGFSQTLLSAIEEDGSVISSTNIRNAVTTGAFGSVTTWLGRPYNLSGPVVHGDGRGRTINIPTSNVNFPAEKVLPAPGVYACVVEVSGQTHYAVANFGFRPTFSQAAPQPRLEAHLLDFSGDLYGQHMQVEFIQRIRPEVKFNGVQELVTQINKDILVTRGIFSLE